MWTEKEAQSVMIPLMEFVDVCIANEEDAEKSLGFKMDHSNIEFANLNLDEFSQLCEKLKKKFAFETVAITLRESFSASRNGWSAIMIDGKECIEPYHSRSYDMQIIDRVGGGDSFASGLIYGLLNYDNTKYALEFAVGASCLKHLITGDFNLASVVEVESLIKEGGSGRVQR